MFWSNIYFWQEDDYFSTAAELTPLLHTWSLAVEEQFYLLFPIFMVVTWKIFQNKSVFVLAIGVLASLALSDWLGELSPSANFFLTPTRVWELLVGSLGAYFAQKPNKKGANFLSSAGLAMMSISLFGLNESMPLPGYLSLLPVLGTLLVLIYGVNSKFTNIILGIRPLVFIGLISYPLYLWHQPVFAFYRMENGVGLSFWEATSLIALISLLAFVTYRFVESPIRERRFLIGWRLPAVAVSVASATLAVGIFLDSSGGTSYRFNLPSPPQAWPENSCGTKMEESDFSKAVESCLSFTPEETSPRIFLIGDSHAEQIFYPLRLVAEKRGFELSFLNTGAYSAFPYSFLKDTEAKDPALDLILSNSKKGDILMASFHRGHLNPSRDSHFTMSRLQGNDGKARAFSRNFDKYLDAFGKKGIRTIMVKDGPLLRDSDNSLEACMEEFLTTGARSCQLSMPEDQETKYWQNQIFDMLAEKHELATTIDYSSELFTDGRFSPISESGEYLMRDRHHLSLVGSLYLQDFFDRQLFSFAG
jgi:hypothetical protein